MPAIREQPRYPARMTKDDIQLLYEYDRWANARVIEAAAALSPEQFTRDLGGSFRSVRDTLVHILAGEWIWLAYWNAPSLNPATISDLRAQREAIFNPTLFPSLTAVQSKWAEIEKDQIQFVNRQTNEDLKKMLPGRGTELSLAHMMQHMANHSTYHRGQLSLMMRQLHAEPVATDFVLFLAERGVAAATS